MSRVTNKAAARLVAPGLSLLAFGLLLGIATAGIRTLSAEIEIMHAIQSAAWPGIDFIAWAASRAGDALPSLLLASLIAATLCALRDRSDLALFILAATALRVAGPPLKWLFESPRPPVETIAILEHADGFGYPSGHAFGAALVYGAIAIALPAVVPRPLAGVIVRLGACAVIVLVALSRVRLGVHWPSDVAGGLAFGLGLLSLLLAALLLHDARALRR